MVCTGFKAIIDIAFAPNSGRLSRVDLNDCSRTTAMDGLNRPTSVAVGADGAIYVTNNGVTAGAGQVLRIQ